MTRVRGLHLLHSEELAPNSFYAAAGGYDVNTVFQVWGARDRGAMERTKSCDDYVEIRTVCTNPSRRCGIAADGQVRFFSFKALSTRIARRRWLQILPR